MRLDPFLTSSWNPQGKGVNVLKSFASGGVWEPFEPLEGKFRDGVSLCGDPEGGAADFSRTGRFGPPHAMPFVASYKPGEVAEFEFDLNTPHGGYLEFYLCDVSGGGDVDRSAYQNGNCHQLQRAPNPICDSGTNDACGPIDEVYPSRWYLPCRKSAAQFQHQIVGKGGTMTYQIPNIVMKQAVMNVYWLTGNSCNPRGIEEYFTSGMWPVIGNCPGDGGTIGGWGRMHSGTCRTQPGKFPEEFFNCADVEVVGEASAPVTAIAVTTAEVTTSEVTTREATTTMPETITTPQVTTMDVTMTEATAMQVTTTEMRREEAALTAATTVATPEVTTKEAMFTSTTDMAPRMTPPPAPATTAIPASNENGTTEELATGDGAPEAGFPLKPDCMPKFYKMHANKPDYLSYWRQLQKTCEDTEMSMEEDDSKNPPAVDFKLRPGCMPIWNEQRLDDKGYIGYWKQLQNNCKE